MAIALALAEMLLFHSLHLEIGILRNHVTRKLKLITIWVGDVIDALTAS